MTQSNTEKTDIPWSILFFLTAMMSLCVGLWVPVQDPDQGWLRWAGEQILAGNYPRTNTLSWTAPDMPWVLHETIPAILYGWVPLWLVPFVRGVLFLTTLGLVLRILRTRNAIAAMLVLFFWSRAYAFAKSERPLAFGLIFLLVLVLLTERSVHKWRMPLAALWVALWASVHGSFIFGLGFLFLVSPGWAVIAMLGTLMNPQGIGLYSLVVAYLFGEGSIGVLNGQISEWGWLQFGDYFQLTHFVSVCVLCGFVLLGFSQEDTTKALLPLRWRKVILVLVSLAITIRSVRNGPIAATMLLPFCEEAVASRLPSRLLAKRIKEICIGAGALCVLGTLWIPLVPNGIDQALVAMIPKGARVWNDHPLGGWLGREGVPIFWDGRNDCYPPDVMRDGFTIEDGTPLSLEPLVRWRIDVVLTRRAPLVEVLHGAGWHTIKETHGLTLLAH